MQQAKLAGYSKANIPLNKGLKYVNNTNVFKDIDYRAQLSILELFVNVNQNTDFKKYLDEIPFDTLSLYEQVLYLKISQHANLPIDLDSLLQKANYTTLGGMYWDRENYRTWRGNFITTTLNAYDIFKKAGREDICKKIRLFFLEKRRYNGWRNTFETGLILQTILPDILKTQGKKFDNQLTINGQKVNQLNQNQQLDFDNINQIIFEHQGKSPIFITAYQTFHNENPQPKSDIFKINTSFYKYNNYGKQIAVDAQKGEIITLKVDIFAKEEADFVMVEIPIPAGFEYVRKTNYWSSEHREYFKNKVSIFYDQLPYGSETIEIKLRATHTGTFTLNPAKVEQMYFPIFYGRNEMKQVKVK